MTVKRFWDDPTQTTLETSVCRVDGDVVMLAESIFFAFSGGQESDSGHIGGHPVVAAHRDGPDLYYTLPAGHGLRVGDPVQVEIDGTRRRRLMRLHFAAELILELTGRMLPGIEKVGAHIAETHARVDFDWPQPLTPHLPALAAAAHALIAADQRIETRFTDHVRERRCWSVAGFAEVACGGTHVASTGEVGTILLKRKNIGRGKERIEIRLAEA